MWRALGWWRVLPSLSLPCDSTENGETPFWLSVVAFGKQAEALARHVKGELISVSGTMQINQWTTKDGSTSSGYQMVADSVIRVRAVRPAGRKGRWGQASDAPQRAREQPQPALGGSKTRRHGSDTAV
ncbi:single-stranded DNA-binding protein [Serratia symbiotica]|uniref:single-stranded DNA-binding protein n=1 Tax=Serratia symbiotica TaxID=138074 RepID=UPI00298F9F21|nr:single-stranded DNA-binding protein [Serratia symbiotica]